MEEKKKIKVIVLDDLNRCIDNAVFLTEGEKAKCRMLVRSLWPFEIERPSNIREKDY